MVIPSLRDAYVCRETIYNAIYALPVGELQKTHSLPSTGEVCSQATPWPGGPVDRRHQIPDMVSIHLRPPEVEKREFPGHWEGYLIKGKGNVLAVDTLVEPKSGYLILAQMNDAPATSAVEGF